MSKLISSLVFLALIPSAALAQITPDSSLGTEKSIVDTNGDRDTIKGGAIRDANLFHSFQEFNVGALREAYFSNPDGIANIFSRVTGNNLSDIQGVLGVLGNANLYLINPNGILFGENARLDVNGSFFATTADSVLFDNGFEFSAANPNAPPLLTIDIPIGLRFRDNPGDITVKGNGNGVRLLDSEVIDTQDALRVDTEATIGLIGGNLIFEDATIKTAGGRIELGSIAEGEVALAEVADGFTVDYSEVETFGDISLLGTNSIDASGLGGGDIQVAAKKIFITGISAFVSHTLGSTPGGDINVLATDSLEINGFENDLGLASGIANRVYPNATADSGDINIETGSLSLKNRAFIRTSTLGQGSAGSITINARDSVSLASQESRSAISSNVTSGAIGNGGNININTTSLALGDGVSIDAGTSGRGNGGNITINATDSLSLVSRGNFTDISSSTISDAVGNAGNINVNTRLLTLTNRTYFDVSAFGGQGNAGNVILNASEAVHFDRQDTFGANGIFANVYPSSIGNGGNIDINTGSLTLNNGTIFFVNNSGQGKGGNVTINATDNISLTNDSKIFVTGAEGGSLNITAKNLVLMSDSAFLAGIGVGLGSTDAKSGDVVINLSEDLVLDGLDGERNTFISNQNFGVGNTGNIDIKARNITFKNGANIASFNDGEGNLGKIHLKATGDITFDGIKGSQRAGVSQSVSSEATGDVGEMNITAQNLNLTNGASIQSLIAGVADSGNINLNIADTINIDGSGLDETGDVLKEINSSIFTNVALTGIGNSGDINIDTQNFSLARNGFIDTENLGQGDAGDIVINATDSLVLNEGKISTSSQGQGDAGDIIISINESLFATDESLIDSNVGSSTGTSARGRAGNIFISAKNISFAEASKIEAGAFTGATATKPGTISLTATEKIFLTGTNTGIDGRNELGSLGDSSNVLLSTENLTLTNEAQITNNNSGEGNSGEIRIDTTNLTLNQGALIDNVLFGTGNAGNTTINATDTVFLGQSSAIASSVGKEAVGDGGEVRIDTRNLILTDGAQIQNAIFGKGNTGDIKIKATDTVVLDQNSAIDSSVESGAVGNAGEVRIHTSNLALTSGAQILSNTFGKGNAGSVTIKATDTISLDGENRDGIISIVGSSVGQEAVGDAGQVRIDTKKLSLTNGAQISSGTFGQGNGNEIIINVTDTISLDGTDKNGVGSAIATSVQLGARGNAGKVDINSQNLFLTNGAFISSSTLGEGNAGLVTVRVSDSIQLSGISSNGRGGLFALATNSIGNGGDLKVFTNELIVSDGASISASNFPTLEGLREPGTGEAGSVKIEANNLTLENGGRINAATQAGDDGNITLKVVENIILRDNSLISAEAFKEATGGNIDINSRFIIAFPNQNNDIIASAEQGTGGNIDITAEAIFGIEERSSTPPNKTNDIDASSQFGFSGTVNITQPTIDPASGLINLTKEIVDPAKLIAQNVCTQTANSEFVNIGKGGLPQNPEYTLAEDIIKIGLVAPVIASEKTKKPAKKRKERIEVKPKKTLKPPAQGWIFHENGMVELVAYNPDRLEEQRTWNNHQGCQ